VAGGAPLVVDMYGWDHFEWVDGDGGDVASPKSGDPRCGLPLT
jgi:hypothetical protein